MRVLPIKSEETYQWCLKKHYAHRIPSISYVFGLYDDSNVLSGIITYGMPPNYVEMMVWKPYDLLELNRLCLNDNIKNGASFLIGGTFKLLPKPTELISYADFRAGHRGYIYQVTNWLYTGVGGEGQKIYIMKDGSERHQRHEKTIEKSHIERVELTTGKARYYYFLGKKNETNKMKAMLRYKVLPYPKGDNKRYDTSFKPQTQELLF